MTNAYQQAGVDVDAGERAVALMRESVHRARRPEVLGDVGGFAGFFDASALRSYRRPLLATATDGVGTKIDIARQMGIHSTIGQDLVAMVTDDLVVSGAEPLFLTDYIACGKVDPERIADIVSGIARGCQMAGCALLGGETAEHPGLMEPDEYDVAAAGTAVVEADDLLGPDRVRAGDAIIGLAASGLHSNGFSLIRKALLADAGWRLDAHIPEFGQTLGEELLTPTAIYTTAVLSVARALSTDMHAASHITGGGIASNIARVLPAATTAVIERDTWSLSAIYPLLAEAGVPTADQEHTFNMGLGMALIVAPSAVSDACEILADQGVDAWVCGYVTERTAGESGDAAPKGGSGGAARLVGSYR